LKSKKIRKSITILIISIEILCILRMPLTVKADEYPLPSGITITDFENDLDKYVNENQANTAALAVAVVNQNRQVFEKIFGYADIENKVCADNNTVYEWGSVTKILTWISVMQLVEQGKLDLNEDIRNYLPVDFLKKISYDTPITMLNLMNHTGGWQDSITDVYTDNEKDILPLGEYLAEYEPIQLYEPGTTVAYSNWGVTLAGFIVEKISGEDYCNYVNQHIFKQIGMKHTSIHPLRMDNPFVKEQLPKTKCYTTELEQIPGNYYAPDYPAAGAAGTLGDAVLLLSALQCENDTPLFEDSKTMELMMSPTHYYVDGAYKENAHGFWYDFYQNESMGHYGNTAQFSMHLSISPKTNTGMIVMTNQAQETKYNIGIGNLVFGKCDGVQVGNEEWKKHSFQKYYSGSRTIRKGYCHFYNTFQKYQVKQIGENEILIASPFLKLPCIRINDTVYLVNDGTLKGYKIYVDADENGNIKRMATSTFDFVKCREAEVIIDNFSFILAAIALLMTLYALGYHILKCIKKREKYVFYSVGMNLLSILFYFFVVIEAKKLSATTASTGDMIPFILFDIIFIIFSISYAVHFIKIKKKNIGSIFTLCGTMIIVMFIIYWQMYYIS